LGALFFYQILVIKLEPPSYLSKETEKGVVVEEINMNEDSPDDLIHDRFARRLWMDHPMGSPILGNLETVTAFNRDDVYGFYKSSYVPSNMVISVAGNVQAPAVKDMVEELMKEQRGGEAS
jgi:predicted Zn-dependent peptidase